MQRVLIVGAGQGGSALLETLLKTNTVQIIAIADLDLEALGARRLYATLPCEAIDMMRFTEAEIEEERCRRFNRPPAFAIGQRISVPKGRWSEFTGKIKAIHGSVADVVLEMAILGRDTVRVEVQNLRQAG